MQDAYLTILSTSSELSATHRLSQSRCSLISTHKVFCGCSCDLLQPPFGRISRNTQRSCYDTITVFDICGAMGRAWIRTMHTRCSYACLPLSYRPPPIVCLQGLCSLLSEVCLPELPTCGIEPPSQATRNRPLCCHLTILRLIQSPIPPGGHAPPLTESS